jgi:hypothetical protein
MAPPLSPALAASLASIDLDIGRTGLAHAWQQAALRRVLLAAAAYDAGVGYVQGLNFVAAFALGHCEWREGEGFTLLIRLLAAPRLALGRALYAPSLPGVRAMAGALDALLPRARPALAAHFAALQLSTLLVFEWHFCLFTLVLPPPACARVWDALLAEGFAPLAHALTLALLAHLEPHVVGRDRQATLLALKAYARARGAAAAGREAAAAPAGAAAARGGGGEEGEGGGGSYSSTGSNPPPPCIDPPEDLLERARGLISELGLSAASVARLEEAQQGVL